MIRKFLCWVLPSIALIPHILHSFEGNRQCSIRVFIREDFMGEHEFSERIKLACENLHWRLDVVDIFQKQEEIREYDWSLTMVPGKKEAEDLSDYLILFSPEHHYFKNDGHLKKQYQNYAGYLTTYQNTDLLLYDLLQKDRLYPGRWYPTVQFKPYVKVNPTRLFYLLCGWGQRKTSKKYQTLLEYLAAENYTNFYGADQLGYTYGAAYRGSIPFDGASVLQKISEMGICLILHSDVHLKHGIPSGRIFEAAAASAVIISDLNQFVIDNFGDSALYIDQNLSARQIFLQIDSHMKWIRENREEALEMARKAHQIFEERFLLENQLLDFDRYHRATKQE